MKVHRYVLTNVPIEKEQRVIEIIMILVKEGLISTADIHRIEEERR